MEAPQNREYTLATDYGNDLFYTLEVGVLLLEQPLTRGRRVHLEPFPLVNPRIVPFELSEVKADGVAVGLVVHPAIRFTSFGSGLVLYYNSWMQSPRPLTTDEVVLALKLPNLYAYTAVGKITVVTTPEFSDPLNDYLTML